MRPSEGQVELVSKHAGSSMSYAKDHFSFKSVIALKESNAFGCVAFCRICETLIVWCNSLEEKRNYYLYFSYVA